MKRSQSWLRQAVRHRPIPFTAAIVICAWMAFAANNAAAQLAANQTNGFGNGRLITFTYLQNFDCVAEPSMDLDFNGTPAQSDPSEMQTPICQAVTEPLHDPTGGNLKQTAQPLRAGADVRDR